MADYERRNGGSFNPGYNRKRRFRDDDEHDRRPQRRRYEEPLQQRLRRQLLTVTESPLKRSNEEVAAIARTVTEHHEDEQIRDLFFDLSIQLSLEQPLKIPFVAGVILATNQQKPDLSKVILQNAVARLQGYLDTGSWREVKLLLRLLGCLHGMLEGDGIFPLLEELFSRAVDLQTASSEDSLGLELVKIILLTLPYLMATNAEACKDQALSILDKTEVISSTPHALYALASPVPVENDDSQESLSFIGQLQRQLQSEAEGGWRLACVPRPWNPMEGFNAADETTPKHLLPNIKVPPTIVNGSRPLLPDVFYSVYGQQAVETVPPTSDITSSLVRDALVDTINILDFNRSAVAKFLIDVDCYFAEDTFVKRATQFDKLRDLEDGKSSWKPEDVAVDAVFAQLFQLPSPEHKLVYYHSVLTEACKIAPAAIAPSLGRAIRWLYNHVELLDLELVYRSMDWFAHHLSNFGFTWKWTEWVNDVSLSAVHPKKAFIVAALEKEIRLSFAARIKGTLPDPYRILISEAQEVDTPAFKYQSDQTPYAQQGRSLLQLIKKKASEEDVQAILSDIEETAKTLGVSDTLVPSTDAYVTTICYLGSKSLSHTLSQIERCRDRLLAIGSQSEAARRQIITSVLAYWTEKPGVGVALVDKLLNYTILTPQSVIEWALSDELGKGQNLPKAHVFEIVALTISKVTGRVRQVVLARTAPGLPDEQRAALDQTLVKEREQMAQLCTFTEDALVGIADGSNDTMAEGPDSDDEDNALLRIWGQRWLRVVKRKRGVEESWVEEQLLSVAEGQMEGIDTATNGYTQNGEGVGEV